MAGDIPPTPQARPLTTSKHAPRTSTIEITPEHSPASSQRLPYTLSPLSASPQEPSFESPWHPPTTPLLTTLLTRANYPPHLTTKYLAFLQHTVLPCLGPLPSKTQTKPQSWTPHLTHTRSPFEPSLNFQSGKQQVRYTFEPISSHAGSPTDPYNQLLPLDFASSLSSSIGGSCPGLDLTWWKYFTSVFFVGDDEVEKFGRLVGNKDEVKRPPTCFLAFDLGSEEYGMVLKPYLFPQRRAILDGKSTKEVVFDVIRRLDSDDVSLALALKKVERFLAGKEDAGLRLGLQESMKNEEKGGQGDGKGMSVEMLSIDCLHPTKSRIKLYVKTHDTSFSNAVRIFTMNWTRTGKEIEDGVKELEVFWTCVFGREETDEESGKRKGGVDFLFIGFEIMPGRENVDVKLYVPSWTIKGEEVGNGLGRYFDEKGWRFRQWENYEMSFKELGEGVEHTYISFAYSRGKGAYVTAYYSPTMGGL